MVTDAVELFHIVTGRIRGFHSLIQFQVEHEEPQSKCVHPVCLGRCHPHVVRTCSEAEWVASRPSLRFRGRKGRETIERCRGRYVHDVQTCVPPYIPKAPRWVWAFLLASLSVRCVTVEKVTATYSFKSPRRLLSLPSS